MEKKEFEITLLGNDVNLLGNDLQYGTIGNGYGLQCNIPRSTPDYARIHTLCNQIRKEFIEIKNLLKKYEK